MPTDVVLIHPGAAQVIYGDLSKRETAIEPPCWARMIAGWLRDRDYTVDIIDQEAEGWGPYEVAAAIERVSPRLAVVVVFGHQPSASTQQMVGASEVAKAVRPVAPVLMCGNHPSALPERTLREEDVTYVADGEGCWTIKGILDHDPADQIPGLVYWENGKVVRNAAAPLIPIDELHGDTWDLLPMDKYRAHQWQVLDGSSRKPYASIYTTLGCPYKCNFCMINTVFHANKYRRRSPKAVVAQIEHLYLEYGVKVFKFSDEMFVLNEAHYTGICEGLARLPFADELNIWAYARVDTVKPSTLKRLRKGGIKWLCLGIEAASSSVRDGAEKHLEDQDIREVVKSIQSSGINVLANFIIGLPGDTVESVRATVELAKSLKPEFANFYSAMGYPGSQLYDQTPEEDLPDSWAGYSQHGYYTKPLPTGSLTSAEVLHLRDEAHVEFFGDTGYLEYVDAKFGSQAALEVASIASRLPRKLLEVA